MKTTMLLDDELIEKARIETGVSEKTKLVHMGLEALLEKISHERLSNLYGKIPKAKAINRRRKIFLELTFCTLQELMLSTS